MLPDTEKEERKRKMKETRNEIRRGLFESRFQKLPGFIRKRNGGRVPARGAKRSDRRKLARAFAAKTAREQMRGKVAA